MQVTLCQCWSKEHMISWELVLLVHTVLRKGGDLNYILSTPDRRFKTRLCHNNALKEFVEEEQLSSCYPKMSSPPDISRFLHPGCVDSTAALWPILVKSPNVEP